MSSWGRNFIFLIWTSYTCLSQTTLQFSNSHLFWPTADRHFVQLQLPPSILPLSRFNLSLRLHCSICPIVLLPVHKSFFGTLLNGILSKAIYEYNPGLGQLSSGLVISLFSSFSESTEMWIQYENPQHDMNQPSNKKETIHLLICLITIIERGLYRL